MRVKTAIGLAALCCILGFALGRLSLLGGGALVRGGQAPLALPELELSDAPGEQGPPAFGPIDVNAADAETLCLLPGIGPKTAEKIIAYREENGSFASDEELMAVDGIGAATYENIRDYICIGGNAP